MNIGEKQPSLTLLWPTTITCKYLFLLLHLCFVLCCVFASGIRPQGSGQGSVVGRLSTCVLPGLVSILPGLKQDLSYTNNASVHITFDGFCQTHSVSGHLISTGHTWYIVEIVFRFFLFGIQQIARKYMTNLIFSISRKNKMKLYCDIETLIEVEGIKRISPRNMSYHVTCKTE